jgi:hypothetical protein
MDPRRFMPLSDRSKQARNRDLPGRLRVWSLHSRGAVAGRLAHHPDEHCPKRPVLLTIDQQFGEGAISGSSTSRSGAFGVGSIKDVESSSGG